MHVVLQAYEPAIKEMRVKYELAMKEKVLMRLEKDKVVARAASLEAQVRCSSIKGYLACVNQRVEVK